MKSSSYVSSKKIEFDLPFFLGLLPALLVIGSYVFVFLFPFYFYARNPRLASVFEGFTGYIAINVAILLVMLRHYRAYVFYTFASAALLSMGILRILCATTESDYYTVWLVNLQHLMGGIFFCPAWLSFWNPRIRAPRGLPFIALGLATVVGLCVFLSNILPSPTIGDTFSPISSWIRLVAGLLYLVAFLSGTGHPEKNRAEYDRVLLGICLILAVSCLFSPFTNRWGPRWWVIQTLQLFPFLVAFAYKFVLHRRLQEELTETARRLRRTNEDLKHFAYMASHDLQEPLRTIASHLTIFRRNYHGQWDAKADELLQFAIDGAKRMQTLIQDLLNFSRIGHESATFEMVDCREALEQAIQNLKTAISESGAQIKIGPLPLLLANGSQLVQLFQNLISNSIKYCGIEPPCITVNAERLGSGWVFHVRDNGIGFEMEEVTRIFLPFQRLHGRADYPGSGIGLALCKRIVETHRGEIWAKSEKGKGSMFNFTLNVVF